MSNSRAKGLIIMTEWLIIIMEDLKTLIWSKNSLWARKRIYSKIIYNLDKRPQKVSSPLSNWTLKDSVVLSVLPNLRENTIGEVRRAHYGVTLQGAGNRTSSKFVSLLVGGWEWGQWIMGMLQTTQETHRRLGARKVGIYKCLLGVVFHRIR